MNKPAIEDFEFIRQRLREIAPQPQQPPPPPITRPDTGGTIAPVSDEVAWDYGDFF